MPRPHACVWSMCVGGITGVKVLEHEPESEHHCRLSAELNAIRRAVADDNEQFLVSRVKGVAAAQELISQLFVSLLS